MNTSIRSLRWTSAARVQPGEIEVEELLGEGEVFGQQPMAGEGPLRPGQRRLIVLEPCMRQRFAPQERRARIGGSIRERNRQRRTCRAARAIAVARSTGAAQVKP